MMTMMNCEKYTRRLLDVGNGVAQTSQTLKAVGYLLNGNFELYLLGERFRSTERKLEQGCSVQMCMINNYNRPLQCKHF